MYDYFDNGWQREKVSVSDTIDPTEYELSIEIDTDPDPVNNGFVGKVEVEYFVVCTNENGDCCSRTIEEDWTWNDKEMDGTDHITIREDQTPYEHQKFTYQYPSRKPYSADNGATSQNINKEVNVVVRYDNGWEDDKTISADASFEATPYEISSNITYECNVDNYSH
jgi:hypothetical protein